MMTVYDDGYELVRAELKSQKKLMTLREVSDIYSISINTLCKWSSQRKLGKYKIGKKVCISPPEFEVWLEGFCVGPAGVDTTSLTLAIVY
jgi:hypothetical protein